MSNSKATQPLEATRPLFANDGEYNAPTLDEAVSLALDTAKRFEPESGKTTITINHEYGTITISI